MTAWLHRRGKPTRKFDVDDCRAMLEHVTRRGTRYRIFMDAWSCKPIWIGRLIDTPTGSAWVTWENQLCADSIEFENGGVYQFPR